jgi:cytochrome c biogenesis factor
VFCIFALVASVWQAADKLKGSKLGLGAFLGHAGVAVLMLGLIVSRGFEAKESGFLMKDHPTTLFGNQLVYKGMTINDRDRDNKLIIEVQGKDKKPLFTAKPGLYKMTMGDGQESTMVWPHIERGILHDTYLSLGQPQNQGTQTVSLKKGEKVSFGKLVLTNLGNTRQGENGMAGTTFGAKIQVTGGKTTKIIEPKMELQGSGGPKEIPAAMDDNLNLVMAGMNAADKSVSLRVDFVEPMYPVEIFHKPFTSLVFAGTFIMTVAGIMSALYRRAPKLALEATAESAEASGKSTSRKGLISTGISQ